MATPRRKLRTRATNATDTRGQNANAPFSSRRKNRNLFGGWVSVLGVVSIVLVAQSVWVQRNTSIKTDSSGLAAPIRPATAKTAGHRIATSSSAAPSSNKVVTAYLEPPSTMQSGIPLPRRKTHQTLLNKLDFPSVGSCATLTQDFGKAIVNAYGSFPIADPFLPWIHHFFPSQDHSKMLFLGQNRRNCDTGKDRLEQMEVWSPQLALFQPVPLLRTDYSNGTTSFRIYGQEESQQQPQQQSALGKETIIPETRFLCRFHSSSNDDDDDATTPAIAHSRFMFNYEYVSWRKTKPVFKLNDHKQSEFWLSQLMFYCDIPPPFQSKLTNGEGGVLVDVVPIRTPPRSEFWLTPQMVGPDLHQQHKLSTNYFDAAKAYGTNHVLPQMEDSGRWANLPVCPRPEAIKQAANQKPYRMVICTWTSSSYHRRGEDEDQPLDDTTLRLREWLLFHRMVGFDHVVIYDNTQGVEDYEESPLVRVLQEFPEDFVTHQPWPAIICNNHRPGHVNPGDRSSQYAAEASCRERYGPLTDWMAFIDTDEYLTPMKTTTDSNDQEPVTWGPILDDFEARDVAILKFKSGRSFPRVHMMELVKSFNWFGCCSASAFKAKDSYPSFIHCPTNSPLEDQSKCGDPFVDRIHRGMTPEPCLARRPSETFLKTYNCDGVKLPRPERFQRAMKQLYRPDYVLSHFVHYSTVTKFNAQYYDPEQNPFRNPHRPRFDPDKEVFVDELTEGVLVHTRSVVPRETMFRSTICTLNFKRMNCLLGYECPDSVEWIDDMNRAKGARTKTNMNPHHDEEGNFCSCWVNEHVEKVWVPKLEQELAQHIASLAG